MGEIKVGTSGYSFPDWVGTVYPRELPPKAWLSYYARWFSAVEIKSTYYRIPRARDYRFRWANVWQAPHKPAPPGSQPFPRLKGFQHHLEPERRTIPSSVCFSSYCSLL